MGVWGVSHHKIEIDINIINYLYLETKRSDIKNIINYQDVDMNNTIIKVNDTGTNVKDNWDDSSDEEEEEQEQAEVVKEAVIIKEEFIKPAASAVDEYDYECDDYDDEEEEEEEEAEYDYDELDQYDKKMGRYVTAPVKKK